MTPCPSSPPQRDDWAGYDPATSRFAAREPDLRKAFTFCFAPRAAARKPEGLQDYRAVIARHGGGREG